MQNKILGKLGENLALKYLQNKGYFFIKRNFRSRFGEIDLILKDNNFLVFVEVKTRFNDNYGYPEEAISPYKIRSIIKTINYYRLLNPDLKESLRIDVVALTINPLTNKIERLKHYKNITAN
jgi:putative endonuclease